MLEKRYNPKEVEKGKYEFWKSKGYFTAGDISKKPFSIVIPPPNVTGKLHIGHAWDTTIQDIIIRYKKMQGFDTCYLPGMDHAGIATQAKVMQKLSNSGVDVTKLTREEFLKKAWEWKDEYAENIHQQWAKMGLALDYTRERFTLDEGLNYAVRKVFVTLYEKGLIYQGERIINWDPVQMTALSNIEVNHQDDPGQMFYFKYHFTDSDEYLTVATTRPETMFGDVCIVVNPKDERYKNVIGKKVINPANNDILPIIGDEYVDLEFGTGAMKCTPAHDPNDFIIGEKYGFKMPIIFNKNATMNNLCGKYEGLDRFECRKVLVNDIKEKGDLVKIENVVHPVGHSERTNAVVEPMLSKQWFVRMRPLAEQALANQKGNNKVNFIPKRFEKTFIQWMEKAEDWCISRQLWWGHRIPAYYNKKTGEVLVSMDAPKDMENYEQDSDVLDTWFSSQLWPFSTFGWPNDTDDLKRYFPTDVLVTAYDIIFFWVSRMIFQSLEITKKHPFKQVLIHGLVRDELGRKVSKQLGNGIDPIEVIENYGADALRYFLTTNSTPGQDMRYSQEKVISSSNYLNKIWNSARYVLSILPENYKLVDIKNQNLSSMDRWIINKLEFTIKNVTNNMDKYDFNAASTYLYNFVYDDFCSQYLEMSKVALNGDDFEKKNATYFTLLFTLKNIILLIYPYTPFIAEELYQNLPNHLESIMLESYPKYQKSLINNKDDEKIETMFMMIRDARNYKLENKLAPNASLDLKIDLKEKMFNDFETYLKRFTFSNIEYISNESNIKGEFKHYHLGTMIITNDAGLDELFKRLDKEIEFEQNEILRGEKMLGNPNFMSKAPENKINEEKEKLQKHKDNLHNLLLKKETLK